MSGTTDSFVSSEGISPAFPGPWDRYIHSPASRTQYPVRVFRTTGFVEKAEAILDFQSSLLRGIPNSNGWVSSSPQYSSVTLDFGKEICGPVSLTSGPLTSKDHVVAFSFSESSQWVGFDSDESSSLRQSVNDGHFEFQVGPNEVYTMPIESQRGGFRYLTIFTKSPDEILDIKCISAHFTSMPHWENLRAYPSYFYCNEDLLNRVWYAAAYTNQISTLAKDQGRRCELESGWLNNAVCCTSGETVITDAPRRDRTVWAGDLEVVAWSQFATIGDSISLKNALDTLFHVQREDGHFAWAGPPICHDSVSDLAKSKDWPYISDTYHLWTMLVARHYYFITGDKEWLQRNWDAIALGMELALTKFDTDAGLYHCTGSIDWGRSSILGYSFSAQVIFYETLRKLAPLAKLLGHSQLAARYMQTALIILPNLEQFWDPVANLYIDNLSNPSLHPQDGNSLVVRFGIVPNSRAKLVTAALRSRWGTYGPSNPECSGPVSPFISGFELSANASSDQMHSALQLIRLTWGFMLSNPLSTGSTMLEAWNSVDGTITYPFYPDKPSFISHCHPWATSPASVLTYDLLGLKFAGREDEDEMGGRVWEFRPQLGDLETVRGGFTGVLGTYEASWEKKREEGRVSFESWVETPAGTVGRVRIPVFNNDAEHCLVSMNGQSIKCVVDEGYTWIEDVKGGRRHEFKI